ncbi:MAG: hypothetical protein M9962_14310 [Oligoflexia bacterium]|nr:hypothetical protein [Oligoflexia bacterium]
MKLWNFLFICLLTASPLYAKNNKKINLSPSYEQKEDPGSATPLLYKVADPNLGKDKKDLKLSASCTDSLGMVHTKSDPGYQACLRTLEKTAPDLGKDKEKQSIGITISR